MKDKIKSILITGHKYRDHDYSAKRLAEDMGISIFQLSRIIRREYGCSYSDLVLAHRIKDARKHLENPNKDTMTVDEIGILSGFRNRMSFFDAFRKITGETPSNYRRNRKKE